MSLCLNHVLAVMDFSVPGIHAAWRAARIARANRASLHLLERLDALDGRPTSRYGPSSPVARSRSDLAHLAAEITKTLDVTVTHSVCTQGGPDAALGLARAADLVVMARQARRNAHEWLVGGMAERVLRDARVAVLIAQRPSGVNYRRTLAAIDSSHDAERLLEVAGRVGAAGVEVVSTAAHPFHALLVRQRELSAALIVIGKTGRPWWADWLQGSLAASVLARATCDVLWVPVPLRGSAGAASEHQRQRGPKAAF